MPGAESAPAGRTLSLEGHLHEHCYEYIDRFPHHLVGEIHLGGHDADRDETGAAVLIDSHAREVADPVWQLYHRAIAAGGAKPTLIEWDNDVPDWSTLAAEAARAAQVLPRTLA